MEILILILSSIIVGLVSHQLLFSILNSYCKRHEETVLRPLRKRWFRPLLLLFPLLFGVFFSALFPVDSPVPAALHQATAILIIFAITWFAISSVSALEDILSLRFKIDMEDNLRARKIRTQVSVLEKVLIAVILIFGVAGIMMTFESIRLLGTSLLASAGVVGIIFGFAAQKTIATLFAGIQIAITQPIRIDDAVIVENEWGWIEEITLTYVVIKIWDRRRLIVPINYFIENSFQNWTRTSSDIIGSIMLHVDYQTPVQELREELKNIVEKEDLWNREVCVLQVVETRDHTMVLRILVTADSSPKAWDLRCAVREKMIAFIQEKFPESLPRLRAEVENSDAKGKKPKGQGHPAETDAGLNVVNKDHN